MYLLLVFAVCFVLFIFRVYEIYCTNIHTSSSSLKGRVFIITGSSSGIGKESARQLAKRHATVILACRNKRTTENAINDIRKSTAFGKLIHHELDLGSLASIRRFAKEINETYPRIDVLINNAGVAVPTSENRRTYDGFECHFGVNYLGHFLLTQLLLPKLIESAPSRIVIVSSMLYKYGKIRFDDLNLDRLRASGRLDWLNSGYCNSKLANFYHGRELAERLKNDKVDVRIVCPGLVSTGIHREYRNAKYGCLYLLSLPFFASYAQPLSKGAQKIVFVATDMDLPGKSGDFYRNSKPTRPKIRLDPQLQMKLWEVTENLVSIPT